MKMLTYETMGGGLSLILIWCHKKVYCSIKLLYKLGKKLNALIKNSCPFLKTLNKYSWVGNTLLGIKNHQKYTIIKTSECM